MLDKLDKNFWYLLWIFVMLILLFVIIKSIINEEPKSNLKSEIAEIQFLYDTEIKNLILENNKNTNTIIENDIKIMTIQEENSILKQQIIENWQKIEWIKHHINTNINNLFTN